MSPSPPRVEPARVKTRASSRLSSDMRRQQTVAAAGGGAAEREKGTAASGGAAGMVFSSALGHKDSKEAINSLDHYKRSNKEDDQIYLQKKK